MSTHTVTDKTIALQGGSSMPWQSVGDTVISLGIFEIIFMVFDT